MGGGGGGGGIIQYSNTGNDTKYTFTPIIKRQSYAEQNKIGVTKGQSYILNKNTTDFSAACIKRRKEEEEKDTSVNGK